VPPEQEELAIVIRAIDQASAALKKIEQSIGQVSTQAQKSGEAADAGSRKAGQAFARLGGVVETVRAKVMGLSTALLGLGGAFAVGAMIKRFADYEVAMTKLRNTTDLSAAEMARMEQQLKALGPELGSGKEKAEGLMAALRGGIEAGKAVAFVGAAAKAAKADFAPLLPVVESGTAVLRAFGLQAEDAPRVFDMINVAADKGKLSVEELSGAVGRAGAQFAGTGLSLTDFLAALSTLTQTGMPAASAAMSLSMAVDSIKNPGKDAAKVAKALGLEFSAAALQSKGLAAMLKEIQERTGGSNEALTRLGFSAREFKAIVPLVGNLSQAFEENRKAVEGSAGAVEGDFARAAETAAFKLERLKNRLGGVATTLGESLTPTIERAGAGIEKWVEANDKLLKQDIPSAIEKTGGALGDLLSLFSLLPEEAVGPAGVGLVGLMIGGPKVAAVMAFLEYTRETVYDIKRDLKDLYEALPPSQADTTRDPLSAYGWPFTGHPASPSFLGGGRSRGKGATRSWGEPAPAPTAGPGGQTTGGALNLPSDEELERAKKALEDYKKAHLEVMRALDRATLEETDFKLAELKRWRDEMVAIYKAAGKDTTEITESYAAQQAKILDEHMDRVLKDVQEQLAKVVELTRSIGDDLETQTRLRGKEGLARTIEEIRIKHDRLRRDIRENKLLADGLRQTLQSQVDQLESGEVAQAWEDEAKTAAAAWSDRFHDFFVGFMTESGKAGEYWMNLLRSLKAKMIEDLFKPATDWLGRVMSGASNSLWSSLGLGGGGTGNTALVQTGPNTWAMQPQAGGTGGTGGGAAWQTGLSFAGATAAGVGGGMVPVVANGAIVGYAPAPASGVSGWLGAQTGVSGGAWAGAAAAAYLGYSLGSMAGQAAFDKKSHGTQELGAVGGGVAGAVIGTMILPGIGTVIGAGIGALVGAFGGSAFGHSIQKAEAHKTIKWAKETVDDLDRVLTKYGFVLGNRPPTLSNYGPTDKYGSPYARWPEMATAPGRLSAFGQSLSLQYWGSHPELEEADQKKLQEWAQSVAQIAEQLAQTSAQIVSGSLADAFTQPDATSAVQAWTQTLKAGVFQAVDGGLAASLMNTAVIQSRMGPLMQRIGTVFGPEAVWGPEMEQGIQAIIKQAKGIAESPEVQALIKTLYQVRQEWGTDLGLMAAPATMSHVPAVRMAGGGLITEPIYGVGRSGRRYNFGEEGVETVTPGSGGDRDLHLHVHLEGAVITDEMSLRKLARSLKAEFRRIDGMVH
jgi:TP901 family phage tail tape measure protein